MEKLAEYEDEDEYDKAHGTSSSSSSSCSSSKIQITKNPSHPERSRRATRNAQRVSPAASSQRPAPSGVRGEQRKAHGIRPERIQRFNNFDLFSDFCPLSSEV
jgi:hypothetical protein